MRMVGYARDKRNPEGGGSHGAAPCEVLTTAARFAADMIMAGEAAGM